MKYNEILKVNESFQYSINLQYDLENIQKFNGYIPTKQSLEILSEYLESILLENSSKATVLIGPYGKGKSHLLLILLNIIGNIDLTNQEKEIFIEKLKFIDERSYKLVKRLFEDKKKFLPVIINSSTDLKQSFLIGINNAIEKSNLKDIKINTYYDSVIEIIDMWKIDYPTSIKILKKELAKLSITINQFIEQLNNYSSQAYEIFKNIYPIICSGMQYNPMVNTNIVKLYEEINHKICSEYGYDGIFVVFDEFSKFIEASIDKNISEDLKFLQDFAEMTSRSKEMQIHLVCITHKSINEYISKIPKNKIDAWRGIEGRFSEIYFTTSAKQNYELISNTIIKDKEQVELIFEQEKEKIANRYNEEAKIFTNLFDQSEFEEKIKYGCFPMSAFTTYSLPLISEKVAQNERTLFTFLSSNEKNTFRRFIETKNSPSLLTADILYDYFEVLFKKELFNKTISDVWFKVNTSIELCDSSISKKILKVLGIIYILNDYNVIPPTKHTLKIALGLKNKDGEKEIDKLIQSNLLVLRRSTEYLDFTHMIDCNLNEKIQGLIKTKYKNNNITSELQNFLKPGYVIPKRYNDDFKMTRYFKNKFMSLEELKAYNTEESGLEGLVEKSGADGVIVHLIYEDEMERIEALKLYKSFENKRVLLKVPNKIFQKRTEVLELLAINDLLKQEDLLNEHHLISDQLELMREDLEECIYEYYNKTFVLPNVDLEIFYQDNLLNTTKDSLFNRELSKICTKIYYQTVIINNEMINKEKISTQILKARNNVIDIILENSKDNYSLTSAEATIYRSTIVNKGLLNEIGNDDIQKVLEIINKFIKLTENKKISMRHLYHELQSIDNGICMRKGIIPIYLAYVFNKFKQELIIYFGNRNSKEVELTTEILNNINEKPEEYYILLEKGSNEKQIFIEYLSDLYNVNNNLKLTYKKILESMQEWIQGLDKLTKTHKNIDKNEEKIIKFRNSLLKYDINVREYLFKELKNIFETQDYSELAILIKNTKEYLDSYTQKYKYELIENSKVKFINNYKGTLGQAITLWFENLNDSQKNHLFDAVTNEMLSKIKILKNDSDEKIIMNLAFIITDLNIGDWNEDTKISYLEKLDEAIRKVEDYVFTDELAIAKETNIKITINSEERTFDYEEVSPLGNTILNNIEDTFEEYGSSITDNEKRNILIKILEQYM